MSEGREGRRWERHTVTLEVRVQILFNGEVCSFRGQASDVSKGGLALFLSREVALGTSVQLEFALPYISTPLSLRGVVRTRTGFTHGIEFIDPTAEQQDILERTCRVISLLN
jgi:hypothetical protein